MQPDSSLMQSFQQIAVFNMLRRQGLNYIIDILFLYRTSILLWLIFQTTWSAQAKAFQWEAMQVEGPHSLISCLPVKPGRMTIFIRIHSWNVFWAATSASGLELRNNSSGRLLNAVQNDKFEQPGWHGSSTVI